MLLLFVSVGASEEKYVTIYYVLPMSEDYVHYGQEMINRPSPIQHAAFPISFVTLNGWF